MVKILSPWLTLVASFLETPQLYARFLSFLVSSVVSCTQCSPTCRRMPLPSLSLWPGRQPYRPRLVGGRRGGGQSSVAPRSHSPPTHLLITVFARPTPCAQSVRQSPSEPVLSRSNRQRLGHLQSLVDGGWHVCQAVFPEPQSAAARGVTVRMKLFRDFNLLAAGR